MTIERILVYSHVHFVPSHTTIKVTILPEILVTTFMTM